jgi:hypothetical protein
MSEFLLENVNQAIAVQTDVNDPSTSGEDYHAFLGNVMAPQIPSLETVTDEEMVGDGYSRTLRNIRNYYWSTRDWQIAGLLNDHIAPILMNGWQGGAVSSVNRVSPSKDVSAVQNISNSTPKLFSLYRHLGGERFINSTFAPNEWTITQEGEARPTFNMTLRSTGHFLDGDEMDGASFEEADIVSAPDYEEFHGAATQVFATDGVETYNWTQDGELSSLSLTGSNNVDVRRRPGDTFKELINRNSGAFARKIRNGRLNGSGRLVVDLDSDLRTFKAMIAGRKLTGLTVIFGGFNKIGATADWFEYEVKIPKGGFSTIEGETDQDFGALALNIQPLRDAVTKGYFTNRTRTNKTIIL